jgi:hypothetical protein
VRLPGLKDVRIRHRKGYYALDDRKPGLLAGAGPSGAAPSASPMDSLQAELRTALTALAPLHGLSVSMSADFLSREAGVMQVVVSGEVDLHDVPFVRTDDRRLAQVDIAGAVFDESGAVVGTLAVERASLDLTDAAYERAREEGLRYQRNAPLKPGRYRVSLAVREQKGGRVGTATQWVDIPDLGQGRMTLSSLFLMKEDRSAKATSASDGPPLRTVQARRVYLRNESLHLQFLAYNLDPHAQLVTQTEIWSDGDLLAATPQQPLSAHSGAASTTAYTRKIKLSSFAPGDYEVRIVVTDARSNESTSQRASFRIQ